MVKKEEKHSDETWTLENIDTLIQWNNIAAYNIAALELSIIHYQKIMRWNVILGLILSTSSGALSAARFGLDAYQNLGVIFNAIFTFMAFSITIFTGGIKVYQIQENLEIFIRIKQEWINFATLLVSEFQLPVIERVDALTLIKNNKSKYLDLMKTSVDIPEWIKLFVEDELKRRNLSISNPKEAGDGCDHDLVGIIYQVNSSLANQIYHMEQFKQMNNNIMNNINTSNTSNNKKDDSSEDSDVPGMNSENISEV
jgi:hypothetical protein